MEELGSSVLREVSKILMNAAIVNGLKSLSGAGGWLGTVGGWISGAVANAKVVFTHRQI